MGVTVPDPVGWLVCGGCSGANPAGSKFCNRCGSPFAEDAVRIPPPPEALPVARSVPAGEATPPGRPVPWDPDPLGSGGDLDRQEPEIRARERTDRGLLALAIGFALGWIPYIEYVGALLTLVGLIYVFLGRDGYDQAHHRNVLAGGALLLLTTALLVVVTVGEVANLQTISQSAVGSPASAVAGLESGLQDYFLALAILTVLGVLANVVLIYRLADRFSRGLLWGGFLLSSLFTIIMLVYLSSMVAQAFSAVATGGTVDVSQLSALQGVLLISKLAQAVPALLFAWAYQRTRVQARDPEVFGLGTGTSPGWCY